MRTVELIQNKVSHNFFMSDFFGVGEKGVWRGEKIFTSGSAIQPEPPPGMDRTQFRKTGPVMGRAGAYNLPMVFPASNSAVLKWTIVESHQRLGVSRLSVWRTASRRC
jgi:hypothetical protein